MSIQFIWQILDDLESALNSLDKYWTNQIKGGKMDRQWEKIHEVNLYRR